MHASLQYAVIAYLLGYFALRVIGGRMPFVPVPRSTGHGALAFLLGPLVVSALLPFVPPDSLGAWAMARALGRATSDDHRDPA